SFRHGSCKLADAFETHKQPPLWELDLSTQILITKEALSFTGHDSVKTAPDSAANVIGLP
ncbi:MAG: hypothetical protein ACJ74G_08525, partial [Blastocatellia bacterium]